MNGRKTSTIPWCGGLSLVGTLLLVASGPAQIGPTFSVDWQGPTSLNTPGPMAGMPDGFFGIPIDEGSILTTAIPGPLGPNAPLPGPLPPPGLMVGSVAGAPGSFPGGLGILPSLLNGAVELDALSYGRDIVRPTGGDPVAPLNRVFFSVDEFAKGLVPAFPPFPPDVASEGSAGALEASADIFRYLGSYGPAPFAIPPGPWNVDVIDGNGLPPFGPPVVGTGLIEPNPPTLFDFGMTDPGDNLDAVDVDTRVTDFPGPIYFSLDSEFPDLLEVIPGGPPGPNNATAISNGFAGGDVLVSGAGGLPGIFIPAVTLGLDLFGTDTDDLDALARWKMGMAWVRLEHRAVAWTKSCFPSAGVPPWSACPTVPLGYRSKRVIS